MSDHTDQLMLTAAQELARLRKERDRWKDMFLDLMRRTYGRDIERVVKTDSGEPQ
jgi:hypothetical protein